MTLALEDLPDDVAALKALLLAERAQSDRLRHLLLPFGGLLCAEFFASLVAFPQRYHRRLQQGAIVSLELEEFAGLNLETGSTISVEDGQQCVDALWSRT